MANFKLFTAIFEPNKKRLGIRFHLWRYHEREKEAKEMVEPFTNFQRHMWWTLSLFGVLRYHIDINEEGRYEIRMYRVGSILFWILWINNLIKFIYHLLTYFGLLGIQVEFLDQMSIGDWLLMYWHVLIECMVWFFKYPMWENLYRQWELQESIYRKLGRPTEMAQKIIWTDKLNFVIYGGVCIIGTFALTIQFFTTPKYALNTYAVVPYDTLPLRVLFCIHECLFMCHGYAYQAFTMVLAESYAVSYQHILEEMNKAMGAIIINRGTLHLKSLKDSLHSKLRWRRLWKTSIKATLNKTKKMSLWSIIRNKGCRPNTKTVSKIDAQLIIRTINGWADPEVIAPGTYYNIYSLLEDYKKIMISAQFHNQWIGQVMGFPEMINYGQFVSDVFMMIQLLKTEDTDYFGVFFYIMDAAFGMVMIFRMLIILSRLYPQGQEFIRGLKIYATFNSPLRKELLKVIPSLRVVSAKLTGYTVTPASVPEGINVLITWYIAAAMWQPLQ